MSQQPPDRLNPYRSQPAAPKDQDPYPPGDPRNDSQQLRKKQIALVVRLMILSVVTTVITIVGWWFGRIAVVPLAFGVALILGLIFTVPWKRG